MLVCDKVDFGVELLVSSPNRTETVSAKTKKMKETPVFYHLYRVFNPRREVQPLRDQTWFGQFLGFSFVVW